MKVGIHTDSNYLKILDSRLYGNDICFLTFYKFIKCIII